LFIPDPDPGIGFFTHPGSGGQKGTGSRIKYFSPEMFDKVSVIGVELLRAPVRLTQVAEVVFLPQVLEQHVLVKKPRPTTTMYL
jgi:hypothetical protein